MTEAAVEILSLPEQIFSKIKMLILSGELKGGERIPEEKIAELFGVSRTPIREALRKLEDYGLIRIQPRKYAEVLTMSPKEVKDVTMLRIQLESMAVQLLLKNGTDEDGEAVRALSRECRNLVEGGEVGKFYDADSRFHLEIGRRSGNPFLYDLMKRMDAKIQLSRLVKKLDIGDIRASLAEHDEIVTAIREKSKEAVKLIEKHIKNNL